VKARFSSLESPVSLPKILLVDDVEFFLEMEKDLLRDTAATVYTARNGKEALEFVNHQRPDIIFMDVTMPVMDGITCCRILKTDPNLQSIPVIMVFAPSRETDMETVTAAGCDGYLIKPVDRKAFLEMGRRFLFDVERREPRISSHLPVILRRQGEEFRCTSEDLGIRGMYVKSQDALTLGDVVRVIMPLPDGTSRFECRARVSWINQGLSRAKQNLPSGFGVEFLQLSQASTASIRAFLDKQKGR
jgi:CheY-like chemotaxis protein